MENRSTDRHDSVATAELRSGPAKQAARTELSVTGLTCSGCVRTATDALRAVPGVAHADVQLEGGRASVRWHPNFPADEQALIRAVEDAGYNAKVAAHDDTEEPRSDWSPLAGWRFNVIFGGMVTVPLMLAEWVFGVGMERWYQWVAFAAVLPVQVFGGARFYRGAWNQLKIGSSNMDTLVALGSTTAFGYSTWMLLSGMAGHVFFMESAAIITLISAGHWVEARVSDRAAGSLRALLNLAPPTARLLTPDGFERDVPVTELVVGHQFVVKPGDRVPIDGEVVEGISTVDESMLTGESVPVDKAKGAKVFAGTMNLHGWFLARVNATGDATALAQIIAVVERAQSSRANIQKLGDRVSSIFVPIVVLIALATALWWALAPASAHLVSGWLETFLWKSHHPGGPIASAIYHAAAVLIIACPCAMGLATPVAIMAGTNAAAERGILIRDALALEKTGRLTTVVFDKTGTLTEGKLSVAAVEDMLPGPLQAIGIHKIAATLAKPSQHPLSQAVATLSASTLPANDWNEVRGAGVQARLSIDNPDLANAIFRMGSLQWLRTEGIEIPESEDFVTEWTGKGATVVGIAADRALLGLISLRDQIKSQAAEVIVELQRSGKEVYLITGDNRLTASAIAEQLNIPADRVFSEIRPEDKARIVERLQATGKRIAFIGDGINDAPALEQADLGIAVSRASDVAREAADIILLRSDIYAVPAALNLAQATLRTIKQNLFWAFFYNAAGVPLAMFGFLSPILSALAMGLSDLIVIGNALRLRFRNFFAAAKK